MRGRGLAMLAAIALGAGACGGDDGSSGGGGTPPLTVSAAASLKTAFTDYGKQFQDADAKFSFAGSDELAAQIEQGVKPDVFAAANTKLPDALYDEGPGREADRVRRQPARARGAGRRLEGELAEGPRGQGREARDRRQGRAGRHLHAHRARQAPAEGRARRSSPTCAPRSPTWGDHRQAHAGRGRRRLPLRLRRPRDRRQAEGDPAAGRAAARRWPTASRSSRARSTRSRPRRSSPGCWTATASRRCRPPASCRRPRNEPTLVRGRAGRGAQRHAAVPRPAGRGDLRRHRPGRPALEPRRRGRAGGAAAEPGVQRRRGGADRGGRHARGLLPRHPRASAAGRW